MHPLSTSNHNSAGRSFDIDHVVLHPLSTSNHNQYVLTSNFATVVLHPLSTSNHNSIVIDNISRMVVLHPLSTSNHNLPTPTVNDATLYCILFLHQTTTTASTVLTRLSCIASSFYIKPQQNVRQIFSRMCCIASSFYIKPQQHLQHFGRKASCIASSFYIKPQPRTPDTLIFGHLTASRHDTKRGGVHRGSRFDAVFTFSTNIRKIIFTEIRRCMSVQRAGARLRSDSSEANI